MTDSIPADVAWNSLPYRLGVGIALINPEGLVWIGRRCDRDPAGAEHWQMPQGGINLAEPPTEAAVRELLEETGTDRAEIVSESSSWHYYDLPPGSQALKGRYRGQKQKWFAMRFLGSDSDFNIYNPPGADEPEFDAWRWVTADAATRLVIQFKRHVYEAVFREFQPLLRE